MIATDLQYRRLLTSRLLTIVNLNKSKFQRITIIEIVEWANAFALNADESSWDVRIDHIDYGAVELLNDLFNQFKILWEKACAELGRLIFLHRIIHWKEHRTVATILNDIELFLEDFFNSKSRAVLHWEV